LQCDVYFRDPLGRLIYHVADDCSLFRVCLNTLNWFCSNNSRHKGQLDLNTILQVTEIATEEQWYVSVRCVVAWAHAHQLRPTNPNLGQRSFQFEFSEEITDADVPF
jgi:hypothetical protein